MNNEKLYKRYMGLSRCKKHGKFAGYFIVCEHLNEELHQGVCSNLVPVNTFGFMFCKPCWREIKLGEERMFSDDQLEHISPAELEAIIARFNTIEDDQIFDGDILEKASSWCYQCVKEIELYWKRSQHQPIPFEIFEKTLLEQNRDTIKELELHLKKHYSFQQSIIFMSPDFPALFINPGGITKPLEIKMYYVTDLREQHFLLELIDDFFSNVPLYQRHVKFFEAENRVVESDENKMVSYPGSEKLLLERKIT